MRLSGRTALWMAACFIVSLVASHIATAQSTPANLSDASKAKFAAYDTRIIAAIRASKVAKVPARQIPEVFPRKYGLEIFRDVFGADWTPIREYADAALAALPMVDEVKRFAASPIKKFSMKAGDSILAGTLAKAKAFEEGLATARLWDPRQVAALASSMVLGRTTAAELAHHSVTRGYVPQYLAKTTWQGRPALVSYQGAWVVVANYIRTPGGLIWATEIALYPR